MATMMYLTYDKLHSYPDTYISRYYKNRDVELIEPLILYMKDGLYHVIKEQRELFEAFKRSNPGFTIIGIERKQVVNS